MPVVAEIVSVGTEVLMGQITDTNAREIGEMLPDLGIRHHCRQTVGDNVGRLVAALQLALSRSDIVFTIGGLGPTLDDVTREGIAQALDEPLVHDPAIEATVREVFRQRKIPWTDAQLRQALRPPCAQPVPNPNGTAPGLVAEKGGKVVIALPGPRHEFRPMLTGPVREFLQRRFPPEEALASRLVKVMGVGESVVERQLGELMHHANPSIAPYASPGAVILRVTASAPTAAQAEAMRDTRVREVCSILGDAVYGFDGDTVESVLLDVLAGRGETLAVAESITGGAVGSRLTDVPGASRCFVGGIIAYTPESKTRQLGVPPDLIAAHSPVSEAVARAMAAGVRERWGSTYALALTGNAGPTVDAGSTDVGQVFLCVEGPEGALVEAHRLSGSREAIRLRAAQLGLNLLLRAIRR